MQTKDYLKFLQSEIHSTVIATVDEAGQPVCRVIDIMLCDDVSLYFLTAKGKAFYTQLMSQKFVAVSGMTSQGGTMDKISVSLRGKVRNIGKDKLDEIFRENPYMAAIYPKEESRNALEVFQIYEGQGEYFDLSGEKISRDSFSFGSIKTVSFQYVITDKCIGCAACADVCPQDCISAGTPFKIDASNCIHCGMCKEKCPVGAVEYRSF